MAVPSKNKAIIAANDAALRTLKEVLHRRLALCLVGAGSSVRVGYPTWSELLKTMAEEAFKHNPANGSYIQALEKEQDVLWRAEEYRRLMTEDRFGEFIRSKFGSEKGVFDSFHTDLVKLPFRHILTTNYDSVLESAHVSAYTTPPNYFNYWEDSFDLQQFTSRARDDEYERRYIYLHGRFNDPKKIILTESDYRNRYVFTDRRSDHLFVILATWRVCSIGFSLSDLDLMGLFRQVKARMGPGESRHFAILPARNYDEQFQIRIKLNGKYGIEPIFYLNPDKPSGGTGKGKPDNTPPHSGLLEIIKQLSIKPDTPETTSTSANESRKASIFVSYSHKDELYLLKLEERLKVLKEEGMIDYWTDRNIPAGEEWAPAVERELERADIVVFLISPDFLNNNYIYNVEMKRAFERREAGITRVVPVIIRSAAWEKTLFSRLQVLPRHGKPIENYGNQEEAWDEVEKTMRMILNQRLA